MAEFVVVTKQAERMCASQSCPECPLSSDNNFAKERCETFQVNHPDVYEAVVMQWAAAHPELKYPSWENAWRQVFPEALNRVNPCPRFFMSSERVGEFCPGRDCADCYTLPIPADIAKKLGIKPIEVDGND